MKTIIQLLRESGLSQAEVSRSTLLDTPTINRLYGGHQREGIKHIYLMAPLVGADPLPLALARLGMADDDITSLVSLLTPETSAALREVLSRLRMTVVAD
jgi:transcriptional regulator with XRE-family HTH domain